MAVAIVSSLSSAGGEVDGDVAYAERATWQLPTTEPGRLGDASLPGARSRIDRNHCTCKPQGGRAPCASEAVAWHRHAMCRLQSIARDATPASGDACTVPPPIHTRPSPVGGALRAAMHGHRSPSPLTVARPSYPGRATAQRHATPAPIAARSAPPTVDHWHSQATHTARPRHRPPPLVLCHQRYDAG